MFEIAAKEKPKWFQLRWKLANNLVKLARAIHPRNPEVYAFMMQMAVDELICGKAVVRIEPDELYKTKDSE